MTRAEGELIAMLIMGLIGARMIMKMLVLELKDYLRGDDDTIFNR